MTIAPLGHVRSADRSAASGRECSVAGEGGSVDRAASGLRLLRILRRRRVISWCHGVRIANLAVAALDGYLAATAVGNDLPRAFNRFSLRTVERTRPFGPWGDHLPGAIRGTARRRGAPVWDAGA